MRACVPLSVNRLPHFSIKIDNSTSPSQAAEPRSTRTSPCGLLPEDQKAKLPNSKALAPEPPVRAAAPAPTNSTQSRPSDQGGSSSCARIQPTRRLPDGSVRSRENVASSTAATQPAATKSVEERRLRDAYGALWRSSSVEISESEPEELDSSESEDEQGRGRVTHLVDIPTWATLSGTTPAISSAGRSAPSATPHPVASSSRLPPVVSKSKRSGNQVPVNHDGDVVPSRRVYPMEVDSSSDEGVRRAFNDRQTNGTSGRPERNMRNGTEHGLSAYSARDDGEPSGRKVIASRNLGARGQIWLSSDEEPQRKEGSKGKQPMVPRTFRSREIGDLGNEELEQRRPSSKIPPTVSRGQTGASVASVLDRRLWFHSDESDDEPNSTTTKRPRPATNPSSSGAVIPERRQRNQRSHSSSETSESESESESDELSESDREGQNAFRPTTSVNVTLPKVEFGRARRLVRHGHNRPLVAVTIRGDVQFVDRNQKLSSPLTIVTCCLPM